MGLARCLSNYVLEKWEGSRVTREGLGEAIPQKQSDSPQTTKEKQRNPKILHLTPWGEFEFCFHQAEQISEESNWLQTLAIRNHESLGLKNF